MSDTGYLPYGRQWIDDDDVAAVVAALRSPLITCGPRVRAFEEDLAAFVGAPYASAVSSGTAALHLAYRALGLGAGDEIITTPVTFAATAAAAVQCGAEVRFADVCPSTGNIDVDSAASLVSPRTRGIAAVHLGGQPADLRELRALCDAHGLWLVEDASHALGATYRGTRVGSGAFSDASVFSFHPVKHVTCGEGGAVTTGRPDVKRAVDRLRHHGVIREPHDMDRDPPGPWYYEIHELGFNYRLSDLHAALGRSQLAKQPAWLERRRELADRYRTRIAARFGGLVSGQRSHADRASAYHLFVALIEFDAFGTTRADVMQSLHDRGIGTQVHYVPVSDQPFYRGCITAGALDGAHDYYSRALSLPMYPGLADADVDRVVEGLELALDAGTATRRKAA